MIPAVTRGNLQLKVEQDDIGLQLPARTSPPFASAAMLTTSPSSSSNSAITARSMGHHRSPARAAVKHAGAGMQRVSMAMSRHRVIASAASPWKPCPVGTPSRRRPVQQFCSRPHRGLDCAVLEMMQLVRRIEGSPASADPPRIRSARSRRGRVRRTDKDRSAGHRLLARQ